MARYYMVMAAVLLATGLACNKDKPPVESGDVDESEKSPAAAEETRPEEDNPAPKPAPEKEATMIPPDSPLLDPEKASRTAPDKFTVKLETVRGDILIDVQREWAPRGADRFYGLVKAGYYDDVAFFRVVGGFMAQVGIHGDPRVNAVWRSARIADDPVKESNTRGMVSFATSGPDSRTTQFFINFADNSRLDGMGFSPFGKVRDMTPVDLVYSGYGEGAPRGRGPVQARIQSEGNAYLHAEFPKLDYIRKATIVD
jgi:peptidyl-prolyl cis-trans isomerase A (cyclophilin A)